ncbi:unnamed protein product [Cutaneotrichosporon oleaginosum]
MPRARSPSPLPRGREHRNSTSPARNRRSVARQAWTPEEEEVWRQVVINVLRVHLLAAIRSDGRLEHRSGSLGAHLKAYLRKF